VSGGGACGSADGGRSAVLEVHPTAFVGYGAHHPALPARGDGALDRAIDLDDPIASRAAVERGVGTSWSRSAALIDSTMPSRIRTFLVGFMS
jgi:hypothetical protein